MPCLQGFYSNTARNLSSRLSVFERKDCWKQGKDVSFGLKVATLLFQIGNTSHFSLLSSTGLHFWKACLWCGQTEKNFKLVNCWTLKCCVGIALIFDAEVFKGKPTQDPSQ